MSDPGDYRTDTIKGRRTIASYAALIGLFITVAIVSILAWLRYSTTVLLVTGLTMGTAVIGLSLYYAFSL